MRFMAFMRCCPTFPASAILFFPPLFWFTLFYQRFCFLSRKVGKKAPVYHRPFLAPCSTSFPTSQIPSMGFFRITWHSGSFRRLACSTPSSSWLQSVDSSGICSHASRIGRGSVPPDLLEFKPSWARVSFFLFFWIWISFLLFSCKQDQTLP